MVRGWPVTVLRGVMSVPVRLFYSSVILVVFLLTAMGSVATRGADNRFVNNGDGTVTDTQTGLMWARTDNMGHINWHKARQYCENIVLNRYDNWRMPTIDELQTLYDASLPARETVCGHRVHSFPEIELSCGLVWSSEIRSDSGQYPVSAMVYNFSKGYQYSARMSQYRGYRALPVRNVEGGE